MKRLMLCVVASLLCAFGMPNKAEAQGIGTDLSALSLCLYADCEARGSDVADPFGWRNPATLGYSLHYVKRGAMVSTGYFQVKAGGVEADVGSLTTTLAWDPFVFQVNGVYAQGSGEVEAFPGTNLDIEIPIMRVAAAIDLSRYNLTGLSIGLLAALPVVEEEAVVTVPTADLTLADSTSKRTIDLTVGIHWRGGEKDWLMIGAMVNPQESEQKAMILDTDTGEVRRKSGSSAALFARFGLSIVPAIPLGVNPNSLLGDWLGDARIGMDVEEKIIYFPGEHSLKETTGYFGLDVKLIPDRWNPLSKWFRLYGIAGKDTTPNGYGVGLGLYGNPEGPLSWFSCNGAWSSRPLIETLGDKATVATIGCSAIVPF